MLAPSTGRAIPEIKSAERASLHLAREARYALALAGLTASHASAYANTIFDLTAALCVDISCSLTATLGGTITIDVTNGTVFAADITAPGTSSGPYTVFKHTISYPSGYTEIEIMIHP
jgi:hypothetical protein